MLTRVRLGRWTQLYPAASQSLEDFSSRSGEVCLAPSGNLMVDDEHEV